ncbi:MAG: DUF4358 domain-containing protein [Lachnospiraceae bacterium]|nr:DUF4358 domain-containing protein [Lachnospiraceae bacterium]
METSTKKAGLNRNTALLIAKYLILLAMGAYVALTVLVQWQKNLPFDQVGTAVEQAINQETMQNAEIRGFQRFYGLKASEYEGVLLYQSVSGMSAEEILLVKVKDTDQLEPLKEAIEKRREARINDFSGYAPEEAALMENAELMVKGKFVLFLPYSEADQLKKAFFTALGE